MATGWTVRGSNPGWGKILRTCPDRPWGPPSLLYNGYRVVPGGIKRPGRDSDPSPPSSVVVMEEYSYTSTPPMGRTACTEPQSLYKGAHFFTVVTIRTFRFLIPKTLHSNPESAPLPSFSQRTSGISLCNTKRLVIVMAGNLPLHITSIQPILISFNRRSTNDIYSYLKPFST